MVDFEEIERWASAGFEALEAGDLESALEAAAELRARRHSAAFEIAGLAHLRAGRVAEAIEVLEEGVGRAGEVWLLWQLLGNARSDAGQAEAAHAAYDRAAACPDADLASIDLNRAILLNREGRGEEAVAILRGREAGPLAPRYLHAQARALLGLGRAAEARDRLAERLDSAVDAADDPATAAALLGDLAEARIELGDLGGARAAAHDALAHDRGNARALWALREATRRPNREGRAFRVLFEGTWPEPFEGEEHPAGFFTTYRVVADDPDEAVALATALEPEAIRPTLVLHELEESEAAAELPVGVYSVGGYAFFDK